MSPPPPQTHRLATDPDSVAAAKSRGPSAVLRLKPVISTRYSGLHLFFSDAILSRWTRTFPSRNHINGICSLSAPCCSATRGDIADASSQTVSCRSANARAPSSISLCVGTTRSHSPPGGLSHKDRISGIVLSSINHAAAHHLAASVHGERRHHDMATALGRAVNSLTNVSSPGPTEGEGVPICTLQDQILLRSRRVPGILEIAVTPPPHRPKTKAVSLPFSQASTKTSRSKHMPRTNS